MNGLALFGAVLVGLSLGLTGAGGSIFALPVLVYLAGLAPADAVAVSLPVVGAAALVGAIQRIRGGGVHGFAVLWFALSGMAGAFFGSKLTHWVDPAHLMLIFAGLMGLVGVRMIAGGGRARAAEAADCRPGRCLAVGAGVGVLTGFLGVGGGFLLMPALMKFGRLPIAQATGTSLAIIALNASAGFLSHLASVRPDATLTLTFAGLAALGTLAGGGLAARLPALALRRIFGVLGLATAAWILLR